MTTLRHPSEVERKRWTFLANISDESVFGLQAAYGESSAKWTLISAIPEGTLADIEDQERAKASLNEVFSRYGDKNSSFIDQVFQREDGKYILLGAHWFQRFVLPPKSPLLSRTTSPPLSPANPSLQVPTGGDTQLISEMNTEPLPIGRFSWRRRQGIRLCKRH